MAGREAGREPRLPRHADGAETPGCRWYQRVFMQKSLITGTCDESVRQSVTLGRARFALHRRLVVSHNFAIHTRRG